MDMLLALAAPAAATLIAMINHYLPRFHFSTAELNLIFSLLCLVNVVTAIRSTTNRRKCDWLIGASATIIVAQIVNFSGGGIPSPIASFAGFMNSFCGVWTVLAIPVSAYLIAVIRRVVLWSQNDWEAIKKTNSKASRTSIRLQKCTEIVSQQFAKFQSRFTGRLQNRKHRLDGDAKAKQEAEQRKADQEEYLKDLAHQKELHELQREQDKRDKFAEAEQKDREREASAAMHLTTLETKKRLHALQQFNKLMQKLRRSQGKTGDRKLSAPKHRIKSPTFTSIFAFLLLCALAVLYIWIPLSRANEGYIAKWIDNVYSLTEMLTQELDKPSAQNVQNTDQLEEPHSEDTQQAAEPSTPSPAAAESSKQANTPMFAVVRYTTMFIALIGCICFFLFLFRQILTHFANRLFHNDFYHSDISEFFNEYSTPISILIAILAVLSCSTSGKLELADINEIAGQLVAVVICILIMMVAVDAIRLTIQQSIQKSSLLRVSMHLIFILFIKTVSEFILGILIGLHVKETLTSIFTMILHQYGDDPIFDLAEQKQDAALKQEIASIHIGKSSRFFSRSRKFRHWKSKK